MENGNTAARPKAAAPDLAERLRAGVRVSDREFDQLFSRETSLVSFRHWTPVSVAARAAALLTEAGAKEILDVGSGPGKVCIVGALRTNARFTGVEQRRRLVEEARTVAIVVGADRARFVHANLVDFDCTPFDGFYFYNPFQEQMEPDDPCPIDDTVVRSPRLHRTYVATVVAALTCAPVGTLAATFHGFGGPMPRQYRCLRREQIGGGELTLWIRVEPPEARASGAESARPGDSKDVPGELQAAHSDAPSPGRTASFSRNLDSPCPEGCDVLLR
jgi:SAM-dependent methyltransferase